ncbi:MAG: hypothetical protein CENE_03777 [Candidatus Celerinatantimonas neptuna]|nr:MAG: hypothetical protein CENE_03777 [Candidatus Celerinatantimonas neptuna]
MNSQITISNVPVHQDVHGRYSLNDLHRASGGQKRHQPSDWLRLEQTAELINELLKPGIPGVKNSNNLISHPVESKKGRYGGTYVCKELVYSYAMWISAAFALKVIRAYDTLVSATEKTQPKLRQCTAEQLIPLRQTAERLITTGVANIYPDIWKMVHQRFDVQHINQLLPEQVGEAVEYLDAIEGEFIGKQAALAAPKLNLNFPMSWWQQYEKIFQARGLDHVDIDKPWDFPAKLLYGDVYDSPSAITDLLLELEKAGFNVQAARFELQAHRYHLEMKEQKLKALAKLTQDYHSQAQHYLGNH